MSDFFKRNESWMNDFCQISQITGKRVDYVQGGGGNTSVKLLDGLMAIKASGYCLKDIQPNMAYAVLNGDTIRDFYLTTRPETLRDIEAEGSAVVKNNVVSIDGVECLRPSVEAGFHSILDKFVCHTHPLYANIAGCCEKCEDIVAEALQGADYSYGIVPYADPGSRLTFMVRDVVAQVTQENGRRPAVLLLKNHGLVVHHDNPNECLRIQQDVNERIAAVFGLSGDCFPAMDFREIETGLWELDCPFLREQLLSGQYDSSYFLEDALYPDQIVFLSGYVSFAGGMPDQGQAAVCLKSGRILFRMPIHRCRVIAETLVCVTFIADTLRKSGMVLSAMGDAAKRFIANWESEKYRRSVSEKK